MSKIVASVALALTLSGVHVGPARHDAIDANALRAADVLAQSRAAYAALQSYADSGTVAEQFPGYTDRYAFRTLFTRTPRNLKLDFRALGSDYANGTTLKAGYQMVLWMQRGELQTWNGKLQEHESYPADGGHQVDAIKGANYPTKGVSVLVPSLLYSKAAIANIVDATEEPVADGEEAIGGRRCVKIVGIEKWRYPSGKETGVRPITLWIDAQTFLIRKVFEDTPKGYPNGQFSRRITTFDPTPNPPLSDDRFTFTVPEQHP